MAIASVLPTEHEIMVVASPDSKRGEKIVLFHVQDIDKPWLGEALNQKGVNNLYLPSQFIRLNELPKLGSGKKDYVAAKKQLDV